MHSNSTLGLSDSTIGGIELSESMYYSKIFCNTYFYRKYSVQVAGIIYVLFLLGVLMSYFVLFPISFRFLGTYSVSAKVVSNITLDSYISTFVSLTLVMGIVFQLPVIAFFLGKMGVVTSSMLANYRKHSLIVIMLVSAIITPPDLMTLILVTIPLYLLYEVSISVVKWVE